MHILTVLKNKRIATSALIALICALILAAIMTNGDEARADDLQIVREALAKAQSDTGAVAATVNGAEIPLARVEAFLIARNTPGIGKESGVSEMSASDFLSEQIDNELFFQEAERRGLVPNDADVLLAAKQAKEGLIAAMEGDDATARALRDMFQQLEGSPYHVSVYDSSPVILDTLRRSIAVSNLRAELFETLGPQSSDTAARDAAVDRLVADLRASSEVRIIARLP